jgi:CrcB protein
VDLRYLYIAAGGAIGSMGRYWLYGVVGDRTGGLFPWGTLAVNVLGSFVIGFFATLTGPDGRLLVRPEWRQFVMVGLCGGFTTFSSFSLETLHLARDGEWSRASANIVLSVVCCLAGVWLGYLAAAALNQGRGG